MRLVHRHFWQATVTSALCRRGTRSSRRSPSCRRGRRRGSAPARPQLASKSCSGRRRRRCRGTSRAVAAEVRLEQPHAAACGRGPTAADADVVVERAGRYCVRTATSKRPELTQFDSVKSMMRYLPANGTAGLARCADRTLSRSPWPPARITDTTSLVGRQRAHRLPRLAGGARVHGTRTRQMIPAIAVFVKPPAI